MNPPNAQLLLEDGTAFDGVSFGAVGQTVGEAVFFTGVVGYQEVLTDPSYRGAILVLTYPIIGSYGMNAEDDESSSFQPRGVVIRDYSEHYSNFRATGSLEDALRESGVVGIRGVDTRAVTVHLRDHGEMRAAILPADGDRDAALARLREMPPPFQGNLLSDLIPAQPLPPEGEGGPTIAVLDLGATRSLLAQLAALGCAVTVLPATAGAEQALATGATGLIAAGGPGDPRQATAAVETLGALLGRVPILGIGLGHQALALALGCNIIRMAPGHHGVNIPVRDLVGGACAITAQHHSFAVDTDPLPAGAEVTHVNVNDQTVEGVRSTDHPAASVQFHPTQDEHGRPSAVLKEFVKGPRATAE